jgi:radical SAM superfamily enzyme YgiQ (UPF0313 family)
MSSALKDSGLRTTFFGIESFHPVASKAVGKPWSGKHGKDFLLKLKQEWGDDITWVLGMIVGLPGEGPSDIEMTLQWFIENKMGKWDFTPLSISRHPDKIWKSEFDLEYEKYGYSFVGDSLHEWKNDIWTWSSAVPLAVHLNSKNDQYIKNNVGLALLAYSMLGSHPSQHEDFTLRTRRVIAEYTRYQLSI